MANTTIHLCNILEDGGELLASSKAIFHPKPRIFLETVSGCNNRDCTSPCSAHAKPLRFMDTDVFTELLKHLRQYAYEIYLYGQGDASLYPFEEIKVDYKGIIMNLTPQYFYRLPLLASMGFVVFLRYDSMKDLDIEIDGEVCGTFMVVGIKEGAEYLHIVKTLLERGYPVMIRSMCNKPDDDPPIPLNEMLKAIKNAGIYYDKLVSGKHPMVNCNVPTIRQEGNRLLFKKCINHDADYNILSLSDIVKQVEEWDCVRNPEDFCV